MSKPDKDGSKQKTSKKEGDGKDKKIRSSNKPPSISKVKVQLPFIREEEVELKDKLGEGAYGEVFKGICRQSVVAVKYIKEEKCDPDALLAELTIMFQAAAENIVKIQGVLVDDKQRPVGIVAEYLDGGDLETLIHGNESEQPAVIPIPKKISYALDICKGMSWLMGKDVTIIHRDLKPANIMLDKSHTTCKICDFGLAVINEKKKKGEKQQHIGDAKSTRGSPLWMAPERVANKIMGSDELREVLSDAVNEYYKNIDMKGDKSTQANSEKGDVYSFGVMLWEIMTQEWPFVDLLTQESFSELFIIILSGTRPSMKNIPAPIAAVIEKCWDNDPTKRPTFNEAADLLVTARLQLALPKSSCPHSADFWKLCFEGQTETTVENFLECIFQQQYMGNTSTSSKIKAKIDFSFLERGIASLIMYPSSHYYTDLEKAKKTPITFYQFANLIDWFGPLKGNAYSKPMIIHLGNCLAQDWFFGPCEKIEADKLVKRFKGSNCFFVRLNTGSSIAIDKAPFVITKESGGESIHVRVYPNGAYGKWVCKLPSGEKVRGDSIENLIANLKAKDGYISQPVGESSFKALTSQDNHGAYATDLDNEGLDEL